MFIELLVHFTSMVLVSQKVGLVVVISPSAVNIRQVYLSHGVLLKMLLVRYSWLTIMDAVVQPSLKFQFSAFNLIPVTELKNI